MKVSEVKPEVIEAEVASGRYRAGAFSSPRAVSVASGPSPSEASLLADACRPWVENGGATRCYSVPYSEHSSFDELVAFVEARAPRAGDADGERGHPRGPRRAPAALFAVHGRARTRANSTTISSRGRRRRSRNERRSASLRSWGREVPRAAAASARKARRRRRAPSLAPPPGSRGGGPAAGARSRRARGGSRGARFGPLRASAAGSVMARGEGRRRAGEDARRCERRGGPRGVPARVRRAGSRQRRRRRRSYAGRGGRGVRALPRPRARRGPAEGARRDDREAPLAQGDARRRSLGARRSRRNAESTVPSRGGGAGGGRDPKTERVLERRRRKHARRRALRASALPESPSPRPPRGLRGGGGRGGARDGRGRARGRFRVGFAAPGPAPRVVTESWVMRHWRARGGGGRRDALGVGDRRAPARGARVPAKGGGRDEEAQGARARLGRRGAPGEAPRDVKGDARPRREGAQPTPLPHPPRRPIGEGTPTRASPREPTEGTTRSSAEGGRRRLRDD